MDILFKVSENTLGIIHRAIAVLYRLVNVSFGLVQDVAHPIFIVVNLPSPSPSLATGPLYLPRIE
jgi:hypothetical protein